MTWRRMASCVFVAAALGACGDDGGAAPDKDPIQSIAVEPSSWTAAVGESREFKAIAETIDPDTGEPSYPDFTKVVVWSSSNDAIVQIEAEGLAEAVGTGNVDVIATFETHEGRARATVFP